MKCLFLTTKFLTAVKTTKFLTAQLYKTTNYLTAPFIFPKLFKYFSKVEVETFLKGVKTTFLSSRLRKGLNLLLANIHANKENFLVLITDSILLEIAFIFFSFLIFDINVLYFYNYIISRYKEKFNK